MPMNSENHDEVVADRYDARNRARCGAVALPTTRETSMGIPALREALLNTFLGDVDERVERLGEAIRGRDARRVEFEAHGLKGMSATIGARHCVACFAELERCGRENDLAPTQGPLDRARVEVARVREFIVQTREAAAASGAGDTTPAVDDGKNDDTQLAA